MKRFVWLLDRAQVIFRNSLKIWQANVYFLILKKQDLVWVVANGRIGIIVLSYIFEKLLYIKMLLILIAILSMFFASSLFVKQLFVFVENSFVVEDILSIPWIHCQYYCIRIIHKSTCYIGIIMRRLSFRNLINSLKLLSIYYFYGNSA